MIRYQRTSVEKIEAVIYSIDNITDTSPEIGLFYGGTIEGSWRAATFVTAVAQVTLTARVGPFAPGETVYKGTARTTAAIDFNTLTQAHDGAEYDVHTRHTEGSETPVLYAYTLKVNN